MTFMFLKLKQIIIYFELDMETESKQFKKVPINVLYWCIGVYARMRGLEYEDSTLESRCAVEQQTWHALLLGDPIICVSYLLV